jgi:hypothetical protein
MTTAPRFAILGIVMFGLGVFSPVSAFAQDATPRELARQAYDRGASALTRDDFATATTEFMRADAAAPSDVALRAAAAAAIRAGDPALAARVLDRAEGRRSEGELGAKLDELRQRHAARLGRVRVDCRAKTCRARRDGEDLPVGSARWTTVGPHTIETQADGEAPTSRSVDIAPGTEALVIIEASAVAPHPLPSPATVAPPIARPEISAGADATATPSTGLSPTWFWFAGGATLVVSAVATWSTLDLLSIRSDWNSARCETSPSPSSNCNGLHDDGKSADTRTVVLWAVAGGLALTTAALGLFFVRWSNGPGGRASVAIVPLKEGAVGGVGARW